MSSIQTDELQYDMGTVGRLYHEGRAIFQVPDIEAQRDRLATRVRQLELDSQRFEFQRDELARRLESRTKGAKQRSIIVWVLSLLQSIAVGIGINYVTDSKTATDVSGAAFLVFACGLSVLTLYITHLQDRFSDQN